MVRGVRRFAALLLLIAAMTNGLLGPLAHGHAMAGAVSAPDAAVEVQGKPDVHAGCQATESEDAGRPAGHSGTELPGSLGLLCSGASACCAALATLDLPIGEDRERIEPVESLRPVLAGLSPPVGERPPSHP